MATDPKIQANGDEGKVTFDEAQQAKVNELIQEAMGRAGKEFKDKATQLSADLAAMKKQFDDAAAERDALKTSSITDPSKGKDGDSEKLAQLQAKFDALKTSYDNQRIQLETATTTLKTKDAEVVAAREEAVNTRKTVAIQGAASKIGFVDVSIVQKLVGDRISVDAESGKFVVLNEQGQPTLNAGFDRMGIEEFLTTFAKENPYLVKSRNVGGAGSTHDGRQDLSGNKQYAPEDIFGSKSDARLASKLAKEDKAEYRRLKALAIESGLLR